MLDVEQPNPKTLTVNGHTVEFQQRIKTLIPLTDRVLVHLVTADFEFGDKLVGQNLMAYGPNGKLIWRVENHGATLRARREDTVTQPDGTGHRRVPQSISDVGFYIEDGIISAALPAFELTIDPRNGKIVKIESRR